MPHEIPEELRLDPELSHRLLLRFIRDEVRGPGFERVVLGLSGGVDSALSMRLAADALGPDNVTALFLPHEISDPQSREDAELAADHAGVELETVDITEASRELADACGLDTAAESDAEKNRYGNIMARMRMIALYDHSAARGELVLGTSNKSEILLGYTTHYGDNASALNPLADLYKMQVWQIADHLGLPERVIDKAPSADLWQDQTDESELGFGYLEADRIMVRLIEGGQAPEEVAAEGFDEELVEEIRRRIRTFQFKRLPPVSPRINERAFEKDFLYLRDWAGW